MYWNESKTGPRGKKLIRESRQNGTLYDQHTPIFQTVDIKQFYSLQ